MSSIEPIVPLPEGRDTGTDRKRALGFGAVIAAACSVLGMWSLHRGHETRAYALMGAGGAVLLYSIVHPAGALVLRRGWLFIGGLLGRVNSVILLSVAYLFVLTPVSLLVRAFSRRSFKKPRDASYFTARTEQRDAKHFEHPY